MTVDEELDSSKTRSVALAGIEQSSDALNGLVEVDGGLVAHKGLGVLLYCTSHSFWEVEDLLAVPSDTVRHGEAISAEEKQFKS